MNKNTKNELIEVSSITYEKFQSKEIPQIMDDLKERLDRLVLDKNEADDRRKAIQLAARVRSSKVLIDNVGKEYVSEIKEKAKVIDEQRKYARDTLDELAVQVRQPATEWEEAEKTRKATHQAELVSLQACKDSLNTSAEDITEELLVKVREAYDAGYKREWEEYKGEAERLLKSLYDELETATARRQKWEAEQAELQELRRLKAEQEAKKAEEQRKQREKQIAEQAAEKARKEEAERYKREQEQQERARKEEAERQRKEQEAKEAAEKKRQENKRHRAKVRNEIIDDLTKLEDRDMSLLADDIIAGKVRHVSVKF